MKRSTVCLERSPFGGLNIPTKLRFAVEQMAQVYLSDGVNKFLGIGVFDQDEAEGNTDPC